MALARHRATDPDHRLGVLVVNPGGPGESGVNFTFGARWVFSPGILARFDIVGFDPRGVGLSQPVRCSSDLLFGGPTSYPSSSAEFESLREHNRRLHEDCVQHSGPIVRHVSTDDVVRDVDALREALGEHKISFYGLSYGTVIGQRYAERHGGNVRAMLLDSLVDRALDAHAFVTASARAAADSFEQWKLWNTSTSESPLWGLDLDAFWDRLLERASRGELVTPGDQSSPITVHDLSSTLTAAAYGPDWAEFSSWVRDVDEGGVADAMESRRRVSDVSLSAAALTTVTCADRDFRARTFTEYKALTREAQRISPRTAGSVRGNEALTSCLGLPDADTPQHVSVMDTEVPTLLLNSKHDPATSYENAASVRRQQVLGTVLVTYEGAGHGVYDRTECTRQIGDAYLLSLTVPLDGSACPATKP
ncbi:alpha/beta fold hydrolase [Streptomyces sp. NPDC096080]|uniref:alpha/beta fold hydrolase n=1 Tax=Streptomyces sp. NPDC096080 TaxID=3156693 RepID=UPI00332AAC8B